MAYWKETAMRVWKRTLPFTCILHHPLDLTQKIDIFDSRAVIGCVERQHTACSFLVMSVSMHKMWHRKVVAFRVWTHNSQNVSRIHTVLTKRIDIFENGPIVS